jgi:hypothetical protein
MSESNMINILEETTNKLVLKKLNLKQVQSNCMKHHVMSPIGFQFPGPADFKPQCAGQEQSGAWQGADPCC